MLQRRYDSVGVDDVADEKTGKLGFAIIDDGEFCGIVGSHEELFGVVDDCIIISDDFRRRIKEFDDGEELTVF